MKKLVALFLYFLLPLLAGAQHKTYVGLETGITTDIYKFTDEGDKLKKIQLNGILWGFHITQDINSFLSIEAGLIRKYYDEGYGFNVSPDLADAFNRSGAVRTWQIPLRIKPRINLGNNEIFFIPVVGYHYCFNSNYGTYATHWGSVSEPGTDSLSFRDTANYSLRKTFSLLELGFGFEFRRYKKIIFNLSVSHYTGFKNIVETNIIYNVNGGPFTSATNYSKGSYWSFGIGVGIVVGRQSTVVSK